MPAFSRRDIELAYGQSKRPFSDAAVLVPLFQGEQEIEILLTQRAQHLAQHPGQVSFPGGRMEIGDSDLEATALRETFEETGIDPSAIEVIGHLPRMYTISFYDVDPVVALLHPGYEITADPSEVQEVFSVPLSYFASTENHRVVTREVMGQTLAMVEFSFENQRIWGATAAMIITLIEHLSA